MTKTKTKIKQLTEKTLSDSKSYVSQCKLQDRNMLLAIQAHARSQNFQIMAIFSAQYIKICLVFEMNTFILPKNWQNKIPYSKKITVNFISYSKVKHVENIGHWCSNTIVYIWYADLPLIHSRHN